MHPGVVTKPVVDGLAFEMEGLGELARDGAHVGARLAVEARRALAAVLDQQHVGAVRTKVHHRARALVCE